MRFLTCSAVLLFALAGCAADDRSDPEPAEETTSETMSATGTETAAPEPTGSEPTATEDGNETINSPPTASLTANGTSGTAPLSVGFTVDGHDAEGQALTWGLDVDGDGEADHEGTALPQDINVTYDVAGTFNATLTVSDGEATGNTSIAIEVLAPEAAADDPNAGLPSPVVHSGSVTVPDPFALFDAGCIMALADFMGSGSFGDVVSVDGTMADWMFFLEPSSAQVTFTSADGSAIGGSGNRGTVGGGMAQGITCATEPLVDYTLTIHHPDWTF